MKTRLINSIATLLASLVLAGCPGLDQSGKDACQTDVDCLNGYHCGPEDRCVEDRACETDADCYNSYHCNLDGECVPDETCTADGECPAGSYCHPSSGDCIFDCTLDNDCPAGYACSDRGRCTRDEPCSADADCPAGHYCDAGGACQILPACQTDGDCPEGTTCEAGDCLAEPECQTDVDCPAGRYCASGVCVFDCVVDEDCAADHLCSQRGRCEERPECAQKDDCQLGELCVDLHCVPGCESGRDCPGEWVCLPNEGAHGLCAECGLDGDCAAGQRCVAFACSDACATEADCQAGQICDAQSRCCSLQVEAVCSAGVASWIDSCGNQTQREVCQHGCDDAGQACDPGGTTVLCPSGCTWEAEIVGSLCDGYGPHYLCFGGRFQAKQDAAGLLHIAWVDGVLYFGTGADGEIRYGRQTVSGFQTQQVDTLHQEAEELPIFMGTSISLAIENDGSPHVGYNNPAGPRYARQPSGSWEWADVFDEDATAMGQLLMETGDRPHLTYSYYVNLGNSGQRYLRWNGADWEQVTSGRSDCTPEALDAGGLPHGVCLDGQGDLEYGHLSGDVWETTHVWYSTCSDPSIALDADGDPHIIFRHDADSGHDYTDDLYYAAPDGLGGFSVEKIPVPAKVAGGPGLVIDPEGRPHVAFRDYSQKALWYGYKHDGQWHLQTVDDTVYYGNRHQIFLTPDGRPTIIRATDDQLEVFTLAQ